MTVITTGNEVKRIARYYRTMGENLVKAAGDMTPSYALTGQLYLKKNGHNGPWIMLSVPAGLVRGVFAAMDEPGIELPPSGPDDNLVPHISVIRPEELNAIGGAEKITERGKSFRYRIGGLVSVKPSGWQEMSKCWMLRVHSPELQQLRRSYGLSSLPNDGKFDFHISVAVRRKKVLGRNEARKAASDEDGQEAAS